MHSVRIVVVSSTYASLQHLSNIYIRIAEVAVSLNTNDVQIYSRQGPDWVVTEALSEVCKIYLLVASILFSYPQSARQADHLDRLGTKFQSHRYCISRQECIRLARGTRPRNGKNFVEANASAAKDQQSCHSC
jgi:hypothetical protein